MVVTQLGAQQAATVGAEREKARAVVAAVGPEPAAGLAREAEREAGQVDPAEETVAAAQAPGRAPAPAMERELAAEPEPGRELAPAVDPLPE
jgi:hypothetical protein